MLRVARDVQSGQVCLKCAQRMARCVFKVCIEWPGLLRMASGVQSGHVCSNYAQRMARFAKDGQMCSEWPDMFI